MNSLSAWERAIYFTLWMEVGDAPDGGYVNSPHDPGGETKWGISKRAFPDEDIKNLTRERAKELYHTHYWLLARCPDLPAAVAIAHFDAAVNTGVGQAAKFLQRLVGAEPDGRIGLVTIERLRSFLGGRGERMAACQLVELRGRFYCDLVDEPENPKERRALHNIEGWVVRLLKLTAYVSEP